LILSPAETPNLSTSLLKTTRFRVIFGAVWFSMTELQAIVLTQYGLSWRVALIDSFVSNTLLAAVALLIGISVQHYNPVKNKYTYISGLVIVLTLIWLSVSRGIILLLLGDETSYDSFLSMSLVIRGAFGLLTTGCMALISVLFYTTHEQQEIDKRRTEAEALSKEAELYRLRQQLQPHFLFNSLNSINALIVSEPKLARKMVLQLSDFLRGTLRKEENQWIPLKEEIEHLQLYLDIEKVRFGHRLATQISDVEEGATIPAMLLQPVIENAIKFGLYDTTADLTIHIYTQLKDGWLTVHVQNPFDATTSSPQKGTGFGLRSIQRRLYLLFARNDLLQTVAEDNLFSTTIKIPQPK